MTNKKFSIAKTCSGLLLLGLLSISIISGSVFATDIAIYGDSQHYEDVQRKIVADILQFKPAAVFRVGDMVDNGNDPEQWKQFRKISGPIFASAEYFPALGNHENDSPLYFETFPFLNHKRWYSVERQGIHFIVLDSNSTLRPGSDQYEWLVSDLKNIKNNVRFRMALFHHPLFSAGSHMGDENRLRDVLLPLFEKYGVRAVFSGHDHSYQRFEYGGIHFIVIGGGGSMLRDKTETNPYLQKFKMAYHFCILTPESDLVKVRVFDIDSKMIDEFDIKALATVSENETVALQSAVS